MTAPARQAAYTVLRRVFEDDAWADRALRGEAERLDLDARDLALATRLAYGAVQRKATLDHVIVTLARRPLERLEPAVVAALRLGIFQLVYLDRVPDHAAVSEAVELAKADSRGGAGLVNAVLRRAAREAEGLVGALPDDTPEQAALRLSHPEWIARLWWDKLGRRGDAGSCWRATTSRPRAALRANTLRPTATSWRRDRRPAPAGRRVPEGLVLDGPWDAHGAPDAVRDGLFTPQSRASMLVARVVDPQPGEAVLDLCAAPGAKTTHLAALMGDEGGVVAVEHHRGRAQALERTARRLGATSVTVRVGDAAGPHERAPYDRVLVDPPCSDLGTLASRAPTRAGARPPTRPSGSRARRARVLPCGRDAPRARGTLVYSTCTISPAENEHVIDSFLPIARSSRPSTCARRSPSGSIRPCLGYLQLLPHRDGTDGFFIAARRRATWRASPSDLTRARPATSRGCAPRPARALSLRELPHPLRIEFGAPRLRGALVHRPHVRSPRRSTCNNCGSSMLQPTEMLELHGVAPSILAADFDRLGAQVGEVLEAGARVIHVEVHGRALRPADHDGAAGRLCARRPRP